MIADRSRWSSDEESTGICEQAWELRRRASLALEAPRRRERLAWPAAVAAGLLVRYASDSLRHRREGAFGYELPSEVGVGSEGFLTATEALTGAPVARGSTAEILINGDAIFPAFLETIRSAERTLNLETYVYWRGAIADEIAEAVCERAAAGVRCKVLLDAVGSAKMERAVLSRMRDSGVEVRLFRPPKPYAMRRLVNRTHRRVLVADGQVGMTGGVGIAAERTGNAEDPDHWRDTHVRIRGPVVRGLQGAFAENWLEATGEILSGEDYLPDLKPLGEEGGPMQLVRSRANVGDTNVEALYFLAIAAAKRTIDLTVAYFAPRPAFVDALVESAQRGVRIRILVPGPHTDKELVRVAGRAVYRELLEAGARIYEYQRTMLHARTMVVDGCWSSVGSVNFDNRSFQLHDEATLCVWSEETAAHLDAVFEADLKHSEPVEAERWSRRSRAQKAAESVSTLFRREL